MTHSIRIGPDVWGDEREAAGISHFRTPELGAWRAVLVRAELDPATARG